MVFSFSVSVLGGTCTSWYVSCLPGPHPSPGQRSSDADLSPESGPREQDGTKHVEEGEESRAQAPPTRSESTHLKTLMRDELLINVQKFTTQVHVHCNCMYVHSGSLHLMHPCTYCMYILRLVNAFTLSSSSSTPCRCNTLSSRWKER